MKLSKAEQQTIEQYRRRIIEAKRRDIIQLIEQMGYDTANIDTLRQQLEAGRTSNPELFDNRGNT